MFFLPPSLNPRNFAKVTPRLCAICLFISLGNIIFGYDEQSFGGVNALPAFVQQFGTQQPDGTYSLSPARVSLIQSIAYTGKFVGCFIAGPAVKRFGHRYVMAAMGVIGMIGIIVQATSSSYVQYFCGRIILYFSVALGEVSVPTYQAELVPGPARGAFIATLVFFNGFGGLIAAIINKVESTKGVGKGGWLWPTCVGGIFPFLLFCGIWFVPNSPRWLISKGRDAEAVKVLEMVRPERDRLSGYCELEVAAIREAVQGQQESGPWIELFRPGNRRRTMIAVVPMNFAQFTGIAFAASYGVRFYTAEGLGAQAFTYALIVNICNLAACAVMSFVVDMVGRRPLYITGSLLQTVFLFLIGGIGLLNSPSSGALHFFVACVMLDQIVYSSMFAPIPYILAAEVGTPRMREKTLAFSAATNVFSAWFISFILPYLLDKPYAGLLSNVGWIFGTVAIMSAVFGYFCIPETKNRALEELNACFVEGVSARKFGKFISSGAAGRIAGLEKGDGVDAGDPEGGQQKSEVIKVEDITSCGVRREDAEDAQVHQLEA